MTTAERGTLFCAVENCLRPGSIELKFGNHYDPHRKHIDYICAYHAKAAQELFAARGFDVPVTVDPQPHLIVDKRGDDRRYPKFKPVDNTEYDDPNLSGTFFAP